MPNPTATPPFEPLDFAPALISTSRMRSSIFGFYHPGGVFHPRATNNGQFDGFGWLTAGKLTDRIERTPRSLSLSKGPHRLGQLRLCGVHSWLLISMDSPLSRGMTEPGRFVPPRLGHLYLAPSSPSRMRRSSLSSASAYSSFRVSASVFSVSFPCSSVANAFASACSSFRG